MNDKLVDVMEEEQKGERSMWALVEWLNTLNTLNRGVPIVSAPMARNGASLEYNK